MFSILILTRDEESNLPGCLDSVAWCDDVVVLDSFSSDRTCDVARARGARVYQRAFDDFGAQRNYALDHIRFRYSWVFHLDADERFNETLRRECEQVMERGSASAYFVANRIIFLGRWIPRCTQYPYPQVRFVKVGEARFAKAGHGQREDAVLSGLGHLRTPYDHYNFSKGVGDWVTRHNRYSEEESRWAFEAAGDRLAWRELFAGGIVRRRAMKQLHGRIPGRWIWKFLYLYVWRRGFLDGYPGFAYCLLQAFYEFLIALKMREHQLRAKVRSQT